MPELLRCQTCNATIERGKITGFCRACKKQTCPNCTRMCEGCLLNFCMNDVMLRQAWIDQKLRPMKLCDNCKRQWAGLDWNW